ncbi:MAG: heat shock protein HspQ [Candidatus Marinimicrobia bacterium]|nr:heat shock protein HspQ [Candidatus Neomarinimicrobiota bacterium]MCF7828623.1 heat shock protein HspQ [Candidatus Neomarinimicrobiota bacterium]MCF7880364.1 heat shock protein HspQ [Candidatus Neomarinimicrobiota bacterium]
MPTRDDLPYILRLIDDDSPVVREVVTEALAEFGSSLEYELANLNDPPDKEHVRQINELLQDQDVKLKVSENLSVEDDGEIDPVFEIGQLVHHKRYGYRGVIVEFDPTCEADAAWYFSNQTQPKLEQPWYYVLVHDSQQVTYAAQTNLEPDNSGLPIKHPLVSKFFKDFRDGHYLRNDRPWPRH